MRKIWERLRLLRVRERSLPSVTARSPLTDVIREQPHTREFLRERYGITPTPAEERMPLERLCTKLGLPPAQILYMQIQLEMRVRGVTRMTARDARSFVEQPQSRILDVREEWETRLAQLPRAERLSSELLEAMLAQWPKDTPLLVFCHHGVRSADAASFLAELGFTSVHVLDGGIDGWSVNVDPQVPRYEGNPC